MRVTWGHVPAMALLLAGCSVDVAPDNQATSTNASEKSSPRSEKPTPRMPNSAEAIRALNHQTLSGAAEIDVVDVYDLLAELALMTGRLPQLLRQLEAIVDSLVEAGDVRIVDGPNLGDAAAVGAIAGHWLAAASGAADELARRVDHAQQVLTWAAPTQP